MNLKINFCIIFIFRWKIRITSEGIIPIIPQTTKNILFDEELPILISNELYPNYHYDYIISNKEDITDNSINQLLNYQEPLLDIDNRDINYLLSIPPPIIEAHRIYIFIILAPLANKKWYHRRYIIYIFRKLIHFNSYQEENKAKLSIDDSLTTNINLKSQL